MLINIFTTVVPSVLRYLTHISYISIFHPEIYIHVDITFKTINGIIIYFLIFNCVKVPIYLGLGLRPERLDRFVQQVDEQALLTHFARLRQAIAGTVAGMPDHAAYIERHVKADPPVA